MKINQYSSIKNYLTAFVICITFLTGCNKFNGDLEYHPINDISLAKDATLPGSIPKKVGDSLNLVPIIKQSQAVSEENVTYLWTAYEMQTNNIPDTISRTRDLKMLVRHPFTLGRSYMVTFRATDKASGVSTYLQYIINVVNDLREGWLVMEDTPQGADFSMILPDFRIFRNLYSTLNGSAVKDKPVKLDLSFEVIDDGISRASRKIYFLTENTGVELDYLTLTRRYDLGSLFFKSPPVIKPVHANWNASGIGNQIGSIINDGKLHIALVGGFPGGKKWADQLLINGTGIAYNLYPFVAIGGTSSGANLNYQVVVYDKQNKRFYGGKTPITSLSSFPVESSDPAIFNLNNVGMDMMHFDASPVANQFNCVMKDAVGDVYFVQFKTNYTTALPVLTQTKVKMNAPDVANLSGAASSKVTAHLFYGAGNKIYRYEPGSNSTLLQYTFPANEQVTSVYCPIPLIAPTVAVVTWNGTEGKLYTFPISFVGSTAGQIVDYSNVYGGFSRIVDVKYKFI